MSGIPVSLIPKEHQDVLVLIPSGDGTVSVSSLREYTLPRAEHQLVVLARESELNWHSRLGRERIDARIERITAAIDYLHGLITPSYVGSPHGGGGREVSGATALGLTRCRFPGCTEYVGDRYERAGACESCWKKATDPNHHDQIGELR